MKNNKLLYSTYHLSLYQTEKGFVYAQRRSINSVACLVFKIINDKYYFLIRYQPMPEILEKKLWSDLYPCPITGSIEENEKPIKTAIREVFEEGGIIVNENNVIESSICISTTQMNEKVYNFLIDATNCKQQKPSGDETIFESVSTNKWIDKNNLLKIIFENKDKTHLSSLESCYLLFLKYKNNL